VGIGAATEVGSTEALETAVSMHSRDVATLLEFYSSTSMATLSDEEAL
jgi:hypothetical protein